MSKKTEPYEEIPMGLLMALAKNSKAQQRFFSMSEQDKKQIIDGTHQICSKGEMEQYVNKITD